MLRVQGRRRIRGALRMSPETRKKVEGRSGGICEAGMASICTFLADEIHHRKSRARRGSDALETLLHLCRACHRAVTDHWADTKRFRTHSWQTEGVDEDGCDWQPVARGENWR